MTPRWWAVVALRRCCSSRWRWPLACSCPWHRPPAPRADQLAALRDAAGRAGRRGPGVPRGAAPGRLRRRWLSAWSVALVLGLTPLGARLVELVGRPFGGHWVAQAVLGGLAVVLVAELVTLPFAAWRHTVRGPLRPVHPGLGRLGGRPAQGLRRRRGHRRRGAARLLHRRPARAALVVGARARSARPGWWCCSSFVLPVLVEPVFNKFTPMEPGPLRTELMALAERDGVPVARRAGRRRVPAHPRGQRLRVRARADPADRRLRHAADARRRRPRWSAWSPTSSATPRTATCCTGTLIGALGAAAGGGRAVPARLAGPGCCAPAGVDSIAEPRAFALLIAVVAVAGLVAGAGAGADVPAGSRPAPTPTRWR